MLRQQAQANWHQANKVKVPAPYKDWFGDSSSMTKRMQQVCAQVDVQVIAQQIAFPTRAEARLLGMPIKQVASIREIKMICDGETWLFGRSIIPLSTLTGKERRLRILGNSSIGKILFRDPTMQRSQYEFAFLEPGYFEFERAKTAGVSLTQPLWSRRSTFYLSNKPMLLTEVFLPAMLNNLNELAKTKAL